MNNNIRNTTKPSFKPVKKKRKSTGLTRALLVFLGLFIVAGIAVFALDYGAGEIVDDGPSHAYIEGYSYDDTYHPQAHSHEGYDYGPHYYYPTYDYPSHVPGEEYWVAGEEEEHPHDGGYGQPGEAPGYYTPQVPVYYEPGEVVSVGRDNAPVYLSVDSRGRVSLYPRPENGLFSFMVDENGDVHVRIPQELNPEDIKVTMPYNWTHEVSHEVLERNVPYHNHEEANEQYYSYTNDYEAYDYAEIGIRAFDENLLDDTQIITEYATYTIVSFGAPVGIMPLNGPPGVNIPGAAWVIPVTTLTELRNAIAVNEPIVAIQLMNNIDLSGDRLNITTGATDRQVHIFSETALVSDAFSINRSTNAGTGGGTVAARRTNSANGRHIRVEGARQLHLWNVTLTRTATGNGYSGGVHLLGTSQLHMHNGSTISNGRGIEGVGVYAPGITGTSVTLNSGARIQGNTSTGGNGGAGILATGAAAIRTYGGSIITNNTTSGYGGGIALSGTATATIRGTISSNNATGAAQGGGGVHLSSGTRLYVEDGALITDNEAPRGGGITVAGARAYIYHGATISFNRATTTGMGGGGGIHIRRTDNGVVTMYGGTIYRNSATASTGVGGGVQIAAGGDGSDTSGTGVFRMEGGAIEYNTSGAAGGGVQGNNGSNFVFEGILSIHGNTAGTHGGGIRLWSTSTAVVNLAAGSRVTNNRANGGDGGGISLLGSNQGVLANGVVFEGNSASGNGGAIHVAETLDAGRSVTILDGSFINNRAGNGGAIFMHINGTTSPANNLPPEIESTRLVLGPSVVFSGNIATNGMRVDENFGHRNRNNIPHAGSFTWLGVDPLNATVITGRNHIFNNYDVNGRTWSYLRAIEYDIFGTAADDSTMTASLIQMTRPRGTGAGAFLTPSPPMLLPFGTLVVVGSPGLTANGLVHTGGGAAAQAAVVSVTQTIYDITYRPVPDSISPTPAPTQTRLSWYLNNRTTLTMTARTPAITTNEFLHSNRGTGAPSLLPVANTAQTSIQNPVPSVYAHNWVPIADIVMPRIDYYHQVTITIQEGTAIDANAGTTTRWVREDHTVTSTPTTNALPTPNDNAQPGIDFIGWFYAPKADPNNWTSATRNEITNLTITEPMYIEARFSGDPDWVRLNNAINVVETTPRPDIIVIHPTGNSSYAADTRVGNTLHLVIRDPMHPDNPLFAQEAGRTITSLPLHPTGYFMAGSTTSHGGYTNATHRIHIPRDITIQAAPGADIILRMATIGANNVASIPPWANPHNSPGRHFVVDTGGTLTLGCINGTAGFLTLDGNVPLDFFGDNFNRRGGVGVSEGGILRMHTNTHIRNSRSAQGGAVFTRGRFYMTGGEIFNNVSKIANHGAGHGAGVSVRGAGGYFRMTGNATIRNNRGGYRQFPSFTPQTPPASPIWGDQAAWGGGVMVSGDELVLGLPPQPTARFYMGCGTTTCTCTPSIHSNDADTGGGVHVTRGAAFTMHAGTIHSNRSIASTGGGGMHISNYGSFNMHGGRIFNNDSIRGMGGGIYAGNSSTVVGRAFITMTGGVIEDNHAGTNGGGVALASGVFEMTGGTIRNNEAGHDFSGLVLPNAPAIDRQVGHGGGVYVRVDNRGADANITTRDSNFYMRGNNPQIYGNQANGNGGGIHAHVQTVTAVQTVGGNSNVTINAGTIYDNTATNGGGIFADGNNANSANPPTHATSPAQFTTVTITAAVIYENNANIGGGIYMGGNARVNIQNYTPISGGATVPGAILITENHAYVSGGGIHVRGDAGSVIGVLQISAGTISENTAPRGAGIDISTNGHVFMENYPHPPRSARVVNVGDWGNPAADSWMWRPSTGSMVGTGEIIDNRTTGTADIPFGTGNGGGVFVIGPIQNTPAGGSTTNGFFNISAGVISGNRAVQGGGVGIGPNGRMHIWANPLNANDDVVIIENNTATGTAENQGGGGIRMWGNANSYLRMQTGIIRGNRAMRGGGVKAFSIANNTAANVLTGRPADPNNDMGTMHMTGGRIYNNRYRPGPGYIPILEGGGVHLGGFPYHLATQGIPLNANRSHTRMVMTGGVIGHDNPDYGNLAVNGGGVWVAGGSSAAPAAWGGATHPYDVGGTNIISGSFYMRSSAPGAPGGRIIGNTAQHTEQTATGNGGGVWVGGPLGQDNQFTGFRMLAGEIRNNEAHIYGAAVGGGNGGGGVYVTGAARFTMHGGNIADNSVTGSSRPYDGGGGVMVSGRGHFFMYNGEISGNTAHNGGGVALFKHGPTFSGTLNDRPNSHIRFYLNNGTIHDNTATLYGGGVSIVNGMAEASTELLDPRFTMVGGAISNNSAVMGGGGVHIATNPSGTGIHSRFYQSGGVVGHLSDPAQGNTAPTGGGILLSNNARYTLSGTGTVARNQASAALPGGGGGVAVNHNSVATMNAGGTITANSALNGGGVLLIHEDSRFNITGTTAPRSVIGGAEATNGNTATERGGGIYLSPGSVATISANGDIFNNQATTDGGGAFVSGGADLTVHGNINHNRAIFGGGVFVDGPRRPAIIGGAINGVAGEAPTIIGGHAGEAPEELEESSPGIFTRIVNFFTGDDDSSGSDSGIIGFVPFSAEAATLTVGGQINNNSAGSGVAPIATGNGGGIWVAYGSTLSIGGASFQNNHAQGMGGAIYTERHDYNNPIARSGAYANIVFTSAGSFSGNTVPVPAVPAINATAIIPATNFGGAGNASTPQSSHIINNSDINFRSLDLRLTFTKRDAHTNDPIPNAPTPGAIFNLYRYAGSNTWTPVSTIASVAGTGEVTFYMSQSRYRLVEASVPEPWVTPPAGAHWYFNVTGSGASAVVTVSRSNANAPSFRQSGIPGTPLTSIHPAYDVIDRGENATLCLRNYRRSDLFSFYKTDHRINTYPHPIFHREGAQFLLFRAPTSAVINDSLITVSGGTPSPSFWELVTDTNKLVNMTSSSVAGVPTAIAFNVTHGYTYQLMEIVPPVGYQLPSVQWRIVSNANGTFGTNLIGSGFPTTDFIIPPGQTVRFLGNYPDFILPLTGSYGATNNMILFATGGIALGGAGLAAFMLNTKKRKNRAC